MNALPPPLASLSLQLRPRLIIGFLLLAFAVLLGLHIAGRVAIHEFGHARNGWVSFFDIDLEQNLPTLFSSQLFLLSALLLTVISALERQRGNGYWLYWGLYALLFWYLSADDMLYLHDRLNRPMRAALGANGALYEAWIVPFGIGLTALAVISIGYLRSLPRRSLVLMLIAGFIFVGCKIGLEMLVGIHEQAQWLALHPGLDPAASHTSQDAPPLDLYHDVVSTFKHSGKFIGLIIYIYALLSHLQLITTEVRVRTASTPE